MGTSNQEAKLLDFSPSIILMSNELTGSQKHLYSTVFDFISLNHRLPKEQAGGGEAQTVLLLNSLYEELPEICYQMLQYFMRVLPVEDVAYIQSNYPNPSTPPVASKNIQKLQAEQAKQDDGVQTKTFSDSNTKQEPCDQTKQATGSHVSNKAVQPKVSDSQTNFGIQPAAPRASVNHETLEGLPAIEPVLKEFDNQDSTFGQTSADSQSFEQFLEGIQYSDLFDDDESDEPKVVLQPRTYLNTPPVTQSSSVDGQIARSQKCHNFVQFAWIFDDVKKYTRSLTGPVKKDSCFEITPATGKKSSRQLQIGDIFLIKDTYYLIADVIYEKGYTTKHNDKEQFRILLISDDGKQGTPFDASFKSKFDKHKSYRVVASNERGFQLEQNIRNYCLDLQKAKPVKGYVYVLRTLSQNPVLLDYQQNSELLKIGFSTQSVAKRIANADKETTFLEAPVEVLYFVECHNYNPHTFEQLIHQVLDKRRLNVKLKSLVTGKVYQPQEWFTISLELAIEVIERIMDNTIFKYHLNPINGRLVPNPPAD